MHQLPESLRAATMADRLIERLMANRLAPGSDVGLHLGEQAHSLQRMADALHNDAMLMREAMFSATARIHKLEVELAQARALSCEDELTGCLNRRGLERVFARDAARAERTGELLCVALLDLDNFKHINDAYGHRNGDLGLIHLVETARGELRAGDAIGRWGGEEFALVLPDTDLPAAVHAVSRVQQALRRNPLLASCGTALTLTFSAGISLRRAGENCQAVIARADRGLYTAKHAGKDRIVAH